MGYTELVDPSATGTAYWQHPATMLWEVGGALYELVHPKLFPPPWAIQKLVEPFADLIHQVCAKGP